ncbi:MAG: TIGR02757 family protein [Bacteroidetes bacterium]|nr:TIGR02757 family protein [Bacteroidota bacterium]
MSLRKRSRNQLLKLKPTLDQWVDRMEKPEYIDSDPIQFLHAFQDADDINVAGFFTATMAWGKRSIVISKVDDFLSRLSYKPVEFIGNFTEQDFKHLRGFKHRTFNDEDMYWLVKTMQSILQQYGNFESFWLACYEQAKSEIRPLMGVFHEKFFSFYPEIPNRTRRHISNPEKGGSCKRLYMYLRWTLRDGPVDVKSMSFMDPSEIYIPLDVHVARQSRKLGLITRNQNDWKAVLELQKELVFLDPSDPSKYDYALFGLGLNPEWLDPKWILNKVV